jgi:shikimate kinase
MERSKFKNILKEIGKKNIAIIGHMGSGKSLAGKIFAKYLGFQHLDSDLEIIKLTNKSINKIFEEEGEKYFRDIETKILLNLIEKKNVIISLGGGSILDKLIRKKLIKKSITVYLDINLKVLEKRLKKSIRRPLLKNVDIKKKLKELDFDRRKYYLQADIIIQNIDTPLDTYKNFIEKFFKFHEKTNSNKN